MALQVCLIRSRMWSSICNNCDFVPENSVSAEIWVAIWVVKVGCKVWLLVYFICLVWSLGDLVFCMIRGVLGAVCCCCLAFGYVGFSSTFCFEFHLIGRLSWCQPS